LARHGNYVLLIAFLRPQGFPETENMLSKIALFDKGIRPDRLQQFFFGNHASRVGHKIQEYIKSLRFERNRSATVRNRARANSQLVLPEPVEIVEAGHAKSSLNCVLQHLNKDSEVVNSDFEDGGDVYVPSWNPMDDPADDSLEPRPQGEQEPADSRRIVRRTKITVEREITTVILRRRDESPGPALSSELPADKDSDDSL
jgi:hypothetical protein